MSQLGQNVIVAYKVQSTAGTAPDATGGKRVRLNQSPGLSMTRALIESNEIRGDMLTAMARLGHRSVGGARKSVPTAAPINMPNAPSRLTIILLVEGVLTLWLAHILSGAHSVYERLQGLLAAP